MTGEALTAWKDTSMRKAFDKYNACYDNATYTAFREFLVLLDGEAEAVRRVNLLSDAALCICGSPYNCGSLEKLFAGLGPHAAALAVKHLAHFVERPS